jgi:hypothetical protein
MEQVRVGALEGIAEAIADTREKKNNLLEDEKGYVASAIDLLHKHALTAYRAYGVELVLVPGGDKLRVRLVEQQAQKGAEAEGDGEGAAAE